MDEEGYDGRGSGGSDSQEKDEHINNGGGSLEEEEGEVTTGTTDDNDARESAQDQIGTTSSETSTSEACTDNGSRQEAEDTVRKEKTTAAEEAEQGSDKTTQESAATSTFTEQRQGDDLQKFAAIPTRHSLGKRQGLPAVTVDNEKERKFAAIPTNPSLGQRRSSAASSIATSSNSSQPGAFAMDGFSKPETLAPSVLTVVEQMQFAKATTTNTTAVTATTSDETDNHHDEEQQDSNNDVTNHTNDEQEPQTMQHPTTTTTMHATSNQNTSSQEPSPPPQQEPTHAEEAQEGAPMVVAELVDPPVEAVQVIFDEGTAQLQMMDEEPATHHISTSSNHRKSTRGWWITLVAVLVIVVLLCIVIVPRALKEDNDDDAPPAQQQQNELEESSNNITGPPVVPPINITYPYECFRSTMDLFRAQLNRPNQTRFILCPFTTIRIGVLADPTEMIHSSNTGMYHSCFNAATSSLELFAAEDTTNNITIRGITFTGELIHDPLSESSSVVLSNKGKNISFVDCLWQDMIAGRGLVFAGNNLYQEHAGLKLVTPRSVEFTFDNCTFRNITYNERMIAIHSQSLTLKRCRFEDIQLQDAITFCEEHGGGAYYCHGLLYCEGGSECALHDICIRNLEFVGLAAILVATVDSKLSFSGSYSIEGITERDTGIFEEERVCESGFSRYWADYDGDNYATPLPIGCIDQKVLDAKWTRAPRRTCMLDSSAEGANQSVNHTAVGYDCYSSTTDLVLDHYLNPEQDLFIICPNTTITIGIMANPVLGDFNVVNGDFALTLFRPNVEVRCGLDGAVENRCILDGGFIQVTTVSQITTELGIESTDNVTIRGLTFTGQIMADGTFGGASAIFSSPGANQRIVNCLWENCTAPHGLIYVGSNVAQYLSSEGLLKPGGVDLIISNSTFRNIHYDGPIMNAWKQNLTVTRARFENIRLLELSGFCPRRGVGHCQSLMVCDDMATCRLGDVCVDGLDFAGLAPLILATRDTTVELPGFHYINDTRKRGPPEQCATSNLAWIDYDGGESSCFDEEAEIGLNLVDACLLD
ncbi:expressed unknown protein [Seminavis robusta]|uniref:Uncharacterized protein n=1 Tax=Seminavis robusta TaxID=568900 RepID=A0A9N8E829_9STRA|nr:expressed unknown protein [Seminavis robusta]|eukprot:Sro612_g175500.1 n/a (1046) ;mRNA; r:45159-48499